MALNRPRGRQKNISGQGKEIKRRGSGLGTGPVGAAGRSPRGKENYSTVSRGSTRSGGGLSKIILLLLVVLLGGGGGLSSVLGGEGLPPSSHEAPTQQETQDSMSSSTIDLASLLGNLGGGSVSSGWDTENNNGVLNQSVASTARSKYTKLLGDGKD